MRARLLLLVILLPLSASGQGRATSTRPLISGDTVGAACSVERAVSDIQSWFAALSLGDTAALRRLATPALIVFSAGRNGLPEPFARADNIEELIRYAARRHTVGDRWSLLEVRFVRVRRRILGFMPITRRTSEDSRATAGLWLGKAEYECGRGVRVLNLAPWPSDIPPYRPAGSRH